MQKKILLLAVLLFVNAVTCRPSSSSSDSSDTSSDSTESKERNLKSAENQWQRQQK